MSVTLISFACVLGAFILKISAVTCGAALLRRQCPDGLAAWLASWVALHTVMLLAMLIASPFGALTTATVWTFLILAFGITGLAAWRWSWAIGSWSSTRMAGLGAALFAVPFIVMAVRSAIYPDFTWDAQTYGVVRLALWMDYGSILVHMPTVQINVFTNEWNAELISLLYGLAAKNLQGFMFGPIEVLLLTFLAAAWLALRLGAGSFWAYLTAAVVASAPACLGLAGVLKGDLLACAALLMAAGWVSAVRGFPLLASAMVTACLALAVGSKITTAFGALGIAVLALVFASKAPRPEVVRGVLFGFAMSAILLSRNVANFFAYGDPFKRINGESAQPSLENLTVGLKHIISQMFSFSIERPGEPSFGWLISAGLGLTMVLAVVTMALQWANGARPNSARLSLLAVVAVGLCITALLVPTNQWSFRYYLPMVATGAVVLLASPLSELWAAARPVIVLAAVTAVAAHTSYVFWPGEINGNRTFEAAANALRDATSRDRTLFMHPDVRQAYGVDEFDFDGPVPQTFAVLADGDRPITPFIGTRGQNRLYFSSQVSELIADARAHCPDFVAVTKLEPGDVEDGGEIERLGYTWVKDNDMVAIAKRRPSHGCVESP